MLSQVLFFLFVFTLKTTFSQRERSDAYGDYYYDRLGYKVYSWCRDSYASTNNDCRSSNYYYGRNRQNDYYDRYPRNNYGYDRNMVNVGEGTFRLINGGRDAELTCDFPLGSHIISNIVWTRVSGSESPYYTDRYNSLRDSLGRRMRISQRTNHETSLILQDYERRDEGIYRCEATRSYDSYHDRGR